MQLKISFYHIHSPYTHVVYGIPQISHDKVDRHNYSKNFLIFYNSGPQEKITPPPEEAPPPPYHVVVRQRNSELGGSGHLIKNRKSVTPDLNDISSARINSRRQRQRVTQSESFEAIPPVHNKENLDIKAKEIPYIDEVIIAGHANGRSIEKTPVRLRAPRQKNTMREHRDSYITAVNSSKTEYRYDFKIILVLFKISNIINVLLRNSFYWHFGFSIFKNENKKVLHLH
jgi:hypothetical protein